ncbi:tripartite tricarboxylate transporter substrate binding protein [Bordetella genomosp. 4]|uniref:ABC transporter substrate-binding protein n=1 Tax=Bordetella genomosp. 4 TaxID=463044 RepID=A0A261UDC6_9BORD|nr:tripartite tricarboxylate transporter substrate binding protein [Bordetella genomosp. 4]OZI59240.1 hypothetical protein CAL20_06390 [Bordetella genomosp. 4]
MTKRMMLDASAQTRRRVGETIARLRKKMICLAASAVALSAIGTHATAAEQPFPSKPITMLVAFPPGGPADVLARALQPTMSKVLGQTVIVENVPGAGGALAARRLLNQPADGYTLILGSPNEAILAPLTNTAATYKPEDMVLLAPISNHPLVVMARSDLPYHSLEEIIAAGKRTGSNGLTFGSPGHGSMYHIISEYIAQTTGAQLVQVPYKGATPMMQDLVGRAIDFTILPNIGNSIQLIETGKIKAVNVLDRQRMPTLPDVPAISESNIPQKQEMVHSVWTGVMTKAGIPEDRVRILLDAANQAIHGPEMGQALALSGTQPSPSQSLEASASFYASEIAKFKNMTQSIALSPQ